MPVFHPERPFLTAEWRDLVMLNYAVDPALLQPLVPRGTELDLWQGEAIASVVGFRFVGTRVGGWRVAGHEDFEEVNLRFYVRRLVDDEVRRGVVFIRELVPRVAIAWTARWLYNERYRAVRMRHTVMSTGDERQLRYEWREGREWCGLEAFTTGAAALPPPGSEAQFITEHYWGYTAQRDGGTMEYEVRHPSWPVWRATSATCLGDLAPTYGSFSDAFRTAPRSAFVAEGSAVSVGAPTRMR